MARARILTISQAEKLVERNAKNFDTETRATIDALMTEAKKRSVKLFRNKEERLLGSESDRLRNIIRIHTTSAEYPQEIPAQRQEAVSLVQIATALIGPLPQKNPTPPVT